MSYNTDSLIDAGSLTNILKPVRYWRPREISIFLQEWPERFIKGYLHIRNGSRIRCPEVPQGGLNHDFDISGDTGDGLSATADALKNVTPLNT